MAASPVYFGSVKVAKVQITDADTTTLKTLATGASGGSKVFSPNIASDDTAAKVVQIGVTISATFYLLGSVSVPIGAGTGAVASVNAFANIPNLPVDNDGNRFVYLESGQTLQVKVEATLTAAKTIHAVAMQEDF